MAANQQLWLNGPDFLKCHHSTWTTNHVTELNADDSEVNAEKLIAHLGQATATIDGLIERSSSWYSRLGQVAVLKKFCRFALATEWKDRESIASMFVAADINDAALSVIRFVQRNVFQDDFLRLSSGKPVSKNSPIRNFNPILINSLIRVGGRLSEAPLSFETKHPAILPQLHHVVDLIIRHYHISLCHA